MKVIDYELFCSLEQNCLECFLYDNDDDSLITCIKKNHNETIELNSNVNKIFFLVEGKVVLNHKYDATSYESGTTILIPRKWDGSMQILENAVILIVAVQNRFSFCTYFPVQMLHKWKKNLDNNYLPEVYPLQINVVINAYLTNLISLLSSHVKCKYYYEIKQQELFYYFRLYYTVNELFTFFSPLLDGDTEFTELVYKHYESVKTIAELASVTHYSVSGFKKRFIKVFGMSPYHWITKEKTKKIHNEITCTQKPFKEISMQYNFCSISHFNRFCKKVYGISPAKLRAKTIINPPPFPAVLKNFYATK